MTKPPFFLGSSNQSPKKPGTSGKPATIGWSVGHPWLKRYDSEPRLATQETLPSRELVDELV